MHYAQEALVVVPELHTRRAGAGDLALLYRECGPAFAAVAGSICGRERRADGHQVIGFELKGSQGPGTYRLFVDSETYLPVMSQSFGAGDGELARGYDEHYTWDVLPDTPANRELLDVSAQHPAAPRTSAAGDAWRSRAIELGKLFRTTVVPGA